MNILKKIVAREEYHPMLTYPLFLLRVLIVRIRYRRTLKRLREKVAVGQKIKVVFMSMDTSKWKCQSIYDQMMKSEFFDPVVALTMTDEDENHTSGQIIERNRLSKSFYEKMGCCVVDACDPSSGRIYSAKELGADIVFYQVPWGNLSPQTVWETSKRSLCCYVPYSVEAFEVRGKIDRFNMDRMADFHSFMYAIFQWSGQYAKSYANGMHSFEWAGTICGFGYPALDTYSESQPATSDSYVIYAPHFSFTYQGHNPILNIGTFPWSGVEMLQYAQQHPEIKWVFKPHPKLRERLAEIGFMTKEEVDAYYAAWENIGIACYDGDYAKWFKSSRAMITDCCSFLIEYMAVGHPLIRLVSSLDNTEVCKEAENLFETFYVAKNSDEMREWLRKVVEELLDPLKQERQSAAREASVWGNHAGKRICDWLLNQVNVVEEGVR